VVEDAVAHVHGPVAAVCGVVEDEAVATLVHGSAAAALERMRQWQWRRRASQEEVNAEVEVSDYRGRHGRGRIKHTMLE
jgi:hypothetical protein